jgi:hypothetical protein
MKINIITDYTLNSGLANEADIIAKMLIRIFKQRVQVNKVQHFQYKAPYADINIFLEVLPNILLSYARMNILIPDQELFYDTWIPYLSKVHLVLAKTTYAEKLFKTIISEHPELASTKVQYLGMTSIDRYNDEFNAKQDFHKCLHMAGSSEFKGTNTIINAWKPSYPHLTVLYNKSKLTNIIEKQQDNIKYVTTYQSNDDILKYMNECGVHICCSSQEGFGHYINEARSCGAIVVTTNGDPMRNFVSHKESGFLVAVKTKKCIQGAQGYFFHIDPIDFQETIECIMSLSKNELNIISRASRAAYAADKVAFKQKFEATMMDVFKDSMFHVELADHLAMEKTKKQLLLDNLPTVSVVTLMYNRQEFLPLAIRNWLEIIYPRDKLEWIVIDDSDNGIDLESDLLEDPRTDGHNITYVKNNKKHYTIAEKRDKAIKLASNEVIVFMDDDDYYPPNSVKQRVLELLASKKQCVFCSTIGCYDVIKNSSIINQPPMKLGLSERVSEASMCFYKSFWESRKFTATGETGETGSEGKVFIEGREADCHEISWEGILVSLLHKKNVSTRKMPDVPDANGNHFGWDNELFRFITSIFVDDSDE